MSGPRRAATLPVAFFRQDPATVARTLVGCVVESRVDGTPAVGRIVETEAYLGVEDPASHAWRGRRHAGNASIYAAPATWYVYLSYGMHWCANLTCDEGREGGAVLLRAVEPVDGLEVMRARRGAVADRLLASGPGRLAAALGITRALDGRPMRSSEVLVRRGEMPAQVVVTPRIGISRAADWPLRFVDAGTQFASRPLPTSPRARGRG